MSGPGGGARASIGLALAFLAGCVGLPGAPEAHGERTFLLEASLEAAAVEPPKGACRSLIVSPPQAAPGFATSRMVYLRVPHQIEYFAFHRWADTPARMLAPLMVGALEASGLFRHAVLAPAPVDAELQLDTHLLRLGQRFPGDESSPSAIELVVRIALFDRERGRMLAHREIAIREPASERSPYAGAQAANRAVAAFLDELIATARAATASLGCED